MNILLAYVKAGSDRIPPGGQRQSAGRRCTASLPTINTVLIDFFLKLKSHKLPVSIKEYLTLLEAMERGVIGPSVEDFYYLSRAALVKDEANFDKFDRAFAEFWQGVETIPGIEAQIPLEWLLKQVELTLSEEEKKQIQALGGWERSEEHTSELQSQSNLVCRLLLEKKKKKTKR